MNIKENNLSLLRDRFPELYKRVVNTANSELSGYIEIFPSKSGFLTCKVKGESGSWITLHSQYDPKKEAGEIVETLNIEQNQIPVIAGIGFGYILDAVINKLNEDQPLVLIEKSYEIFSSAISNTDFERVLKHNNLFICIGGNEDAASDILAQVRMKFGFKNLCVIEHSPSIQAFPAFYQKILNRLAALKISPLKRNTCYTKLKGERLKILVFDSGYFILKECIKALKKLGHEVRTVDVRDIKNNFLENLLGEIVLFKPDFIFSINHLGFDEEGKLTELFTSLKIPFSVWYVDSPYYILKNHSRNVSDFCSLFLWERTYIDRMRIFGFKNVSYLPLATDPDIFKKIPPSSNDLKPFSSDVSFVGNSMLEAVKKWKRKLSGIDKMSGIEKIAVSRQKADHALSMDTIIADLACNGEKRFFSENSDNLFDIAAYLTWKATMDYRLELMKKLMPLNIKIYGDSDWRKFLPSASLKKNVNYYTELPYVYNGSTINFNATSFQMNTAVNQRVFDVAACGAFLLTDKQSDMEDLFEVGKEAICYSDKDEIGDLVKHYLSHATEREAIAEKSLARVLREHTYVHRLSDMISILRKQFN